MSECQQLNIEVRNKMDFVAMQDMWPMDLAWHDCALREMPRKEVVIDCHILVPNCIFFWLQLYDSINKQERKPAGQQVARIGPLWRLSSGLEHAAQSATSACCALSPCLCGKMSIIA